MYAIALMARDGHLLVADGRDDVILSAVTYGTLHKEVKRAYGPLADTETLQDVADVYAEAWQAKRITLRHW